MAYKGYCTSCGAHHEVGNELEPEEQGCMCGDEIEPFREVQIDWAGPVSEAVADAVGDVIRDQGAENLIQSVSGSKNYGLDVTTHLLDHHEVLEAAYDALCEHVDDFDKPAEGAVEAIAIKVEHEATLWVREWNPADSESPSKAGGEA